MRCVGLVKRYGDVVAVDGLDLEVRAGECFGLLGPNGAGKTTTIEILEGLNTADAGEVEVLGLRWATDADRLRQRLGIQLQETQLNEKLTRGGVAAAVPVVLSRRARRSTRCWPASASRPSATPGTASCRAGRSSAWRWPARWPATPSCCSSTSRRPVSIRSRAGSCGIC